MDDIGFIVSLATEATIAPSDQQRFGEQQFLNSRTITDQEILSTRPLTTSNMAGFEYLAQRQRGRRPPAPLPGRRPLSVGTPLCPAGHGAAGAI